MSNEKETEMEMVQTNCTEGGNGSTVDCHVNTSLIRLPMRWRFLDWIGTGLQLWWCRRLSLLKGGKRKQMSGGDGDQIDKDTLFQFILNLLVFSSGDLDLPAYCVFMKTLLGLLEETGLLEEFQNYSRKMGFQTQLMPWSRC